MGSCRVAGVAEALTIAPLGAQKPKAVAFGQDANERRALTQGPTVFVVGCNRGHDLLCGSLREKTPPNIVVRIRPTSTLPPIDVRERPMDHIWVHAKVRGHRAVVGKVSFVDTAVSLIVVALHDRLHVNGRTWKYMQ